MKATDFVNVLFAAEMGKYFKSGKGIKVVEVKEPEVYGNTAFDY